MTLQQRKNKLFAIANNQGRVKDRDGHEWVLGLRKTGNNEVELHSKSGETEMWHCLTFKEVDKLAEDAVFEE